MGVMKTLSLAKTNATYNLHFLYTSVTMAVAFTWKWLAVPKPNRCVRTAVIWSSLSVEASAMSFSPTLRILIDGLATMALGNVFSTHLDAMALLTVMIVVMKIIVLLSLDLV